MSDPMEPIRRLGERLAQEAAKLGLELRGFTVVPSFDGQPDHAQALFIIDATEIGKDAEQAEIDEQFVEMTRQLKSTELEEKEAAAEAGLRRLLEKHGGILGESDDDE